VIIDASGRPLSEAIHFKAEGVNRTPPWSGAFRKLEPGYDIRGERHEIVARKKVQFALLGVRILACLSLPSYQQSSFERTQTFNLIRPLVSFDQMMVALYTSKTRHNSLRDYS